MGLELNFFKKITALFCIFVPKVKKKKNQRNQAQEPKKENRKRKEKKERTMSHLRYNRGTTSTHVVLEGNYFQDNYNDIKDNCH